MARCSALEHGNPCDAETEKQCSSCGKWVCERHATSNSSTDSVYCHVCQAKDGYA